MEETASDDAEREDGVDSVVLGEFEVKDEGGGIEDRAATMERGSLGRQCRRRDVCPGEERSRWVDWQGRA